jgi:hypothetical protein
LSFVHNISSSFETGKCHFKLENYQTDNIPGVSQDYPRIPPSQPIKTGDFNCTL